MALVQKYIVSEEMMACCTPIEEIRKNGIDFDQFCVLATCKGATVQPYRHEESSVEKFREDIKRVTASSVDILVVNYNRKHVGQTGTGHFAPIAGYHEASDKVLLLDVARFKYPPHWVPIPLLYGAFKDLDVMSSKTRGYIVVSSNPHYESTTDPLNCMPTQK
eukprot:TRINITY_DN2307_c0_g1_i2.p1 TRINITY_DN2307_c0_g1~~TRINITY_DN2307_c0_g1_i2.p1  ORF type:complete len:163 (+),score=22.72 TRINITY_DN2307_c0_g1_i2:298-786(+)